MALRGFARSRKLEADTAAATFTFRAHTASDADALELPVPPLPRAVAVGAHGAGVVEAASLAANGVAAVEPDQARLARDARPVAVAGRDGAGRERGAGQLPVGVHRADRERDPAGERDDRGLRRAKVTVPGWAEPVKRLEPFVARLTSLQHADGGWGWWESDESDPYLTVLALDVGWRAPRPPA